MAESRLGKIIVTFPILIGVVLVALYLLSAFKVINVFGFKQINGVFFIIIIAIILYIAVVVLKKSAANDRLELSTLMMVAVGIGLVYALIKFPFLVPFDFTQAIIDIQEVTTPVMQSIIGGP